MKMPLYTLSIDRLGPKFGKAKDFSTALIALHVETFHTDAQAVRVEFVGMGEATRLRKVSRIPSQNSISFLPDKIYAYEI